MRFTPTIFSKLIEPLDRRQFETIVARHGGAARVRSFDAWDHMIVLIFAQLAAATGLRGLETDWNAQRQHHYHLGTGPIARATLADAGRIRPLAIFADTFAWIAGLLDRTTRRDGQAMLCLIDSTPIPLGKLCAWAPSNGRIRGMKVHIAYDPGTACPRILDITHATVNDAEIGRATPLAPGTTYVYDKGYCHYGWWTAIHAAGAVFVTRPKTNMGLSVLAHRPLDQTQGDGCTILDDVEVRLSSKGDSTLPIPLRRITLRRDNGQTIRLITNDMTRSAVDIAALYKGRWQIELLFRWLKQHLRLARFLSNHENGIKLQVIAAMIAYALLRIAAATHRVALPILRFLNLIMQCLFERRNFREIEHPPPVNSNQKREKTSPNQMTFGYA